MQNARVECVKVNVQKRERERAPANVNFSSIFSAQMTYAQVFLKIL